MLECVSELRGVDVKDTARSVTFMQAGEENEAHQMLAIALQTKG